MKINKENSDDLGFVNSGSQPQKLCQSEEVMYRLGASWQTDRHNDGMVSPVFIRTLQPKVHPRHELSPANHARTSGVFQPCATSNRMRSATRPMMSARM
jgi:hypothetical protein